MKYEKAIRDLLSDGQEYKTAEICRIIALSPSTDDEDAMGFLCYLQYQEQEMQPVQPYIYDAYQWRGVIANTLKHLQDRGEVLNIRRGWWRIVAAGNEGLDRVDRKR